MIRILNISVQLVIIAVALTVTACGNTSPTKTANDPEKPKLAISVYELVPTEELTQLPGFASADSILSQNVMFDGYEYEPPSKETAGAYHYFTENAIRPAWVNHCDTVPVLIYLRQTASLRDSVSVESITPVPEYGDGETVVVFRFNDKDRWAQITRENIGQRIALAINDNVVNAPKVNSEITRGACTLLLTKDEFYLNMPDVYTDSTLRDFAESRPFGA